MKIVSMLKLESFQKGKILILKQIDFVVLGHSLVSHLEMLYKYTQTIISGNKIEKEI